MIIAFVLMLPALLIFTYGSLLVTALGLVYALVLYKLAHTSKGNKFVNDLYEYTENLENKIFK